MMLRTTTQPRPCLPLKGCLISALCVRSFLYGLHHRENKKSHFPNDYSHFMGVFGEFNIPSG
jgi:hypothetical protein